VKVLHLISGLDAGGAQAMLFNLIKTFVEEGDSPVSHPVAFFKDGIMVAEFKKLGVPLYDLGSPKNPISIFKLLYFLFKFRPNLIHSALWHANIVSRIFGFIFRVPVVCDLHNNSFHNGRVRNFVEILPIPRPNIFVAVTERVKDSFKEIGRIGSSKIEVILNGIDGIKFEFSQKTRNKIRNDLGILENSFVVGAVGRLVKVKRYDILIESFVKLLSKLPRTSKVVLLLVGDGPEKESLVLLCKQYGIEGKVKFVGHRMDVSSFYSVFDCLAITSESEGLSLVVLEALASGLSIVTTGFNGTHEAVTSEKTGFVTNGDADKTCEGLMYLFYSIYEKKIERKSKLESCFFIENAAHAYINLYKDVVAQQKK
jgi:glycosyltransferase involved in cell wall biosynthesis